MGADDFPTSPAKRQRTVSPETPLDVPQPSLPQPLVAESTQDSTLLEARFADSSIGADNPVQGHIQPLQQHATPDIHESNSLLDALMLQVEAESIPISWAPPASIGSATAKFEERVAVNDTLGSKEPGENDRDSVSRVKDGPGITTEQPVKESTLTVDNHDLDIIDGIDPVNSARDASSQEEVKGINTDTVTFLPTVGNAADAPMDDPTTQSLATNSILPSGTSALEPNAEEAEWEIDSSPYESSSDSDSSDTTSSDEDSDDADGDYAMLDPEEAARILMQGDAGSDDEGGGSRNKGDNAPLRTAHEVLEEVIPKPDIVVTEDMKIEELGNVEFAVESTVVIKAKTSGEYQVLEPGSLVCLEDRSVLGVVADLIGRVEEPRYTIRFTNDDAIEEAGVSVSGTTVFYVPQHSTFVFTQPLKGVKGSDASNFHDEEVGEDEMEFSDDEAEAEHKRQMKARRQGRQSDAGRGRGAHKAGRGSHRGGRGGIYAPNSSSEGIAYGNGSVEMNYDDVADGGDDGYTPLQRPDNLTDMIARGEHEPTMRHPLPPPPRPSQFGRGDFGGRGRGHGRGGRGGYRPHRGRGGGGYSTGKDGSGDNQNGFSQKSFPAAHVPSLNLPITPSLTPQNISYPPMTPSPITPLPNIGYNFGNFQQPATGFPLMQQFMPGAPPPFASNFHQPQQFPHHPGLPNQIPNQMQAPEQNGNQQLPFGGAWASNPALAAALQRQMQEQRRNQGL